VKHSGGRMAEGYGDSNAGLVLGGLAGAAIGYMRWGEKGLLLGLLGALIGAMAETAFTAGRSGRSSLLLALTPLSFFALVAYLVYRYFR